MNIGKKYLNGIPKAASSDVFHSLCETVLLKNFQLLEA
jgi:hypothetical protein